jgi:hypothetical protein
VQLRLPGADAVVAAEPEPEAEASAESGSGADDDADEEPRHEAGGEPPAQGLVASGPDDQPR